MAREEGCLCNQVCKKALVACVLTRELRLTGALSDSLTLCFLPSLDLAFYPISETPGECEDRGSATDCRDGTPVKTGQRYFSVWNDSLLFETTPSPQSRAAIMLQPKQLLCHWASLGLLLNLRAP